jgi:hypothetical protein
MLRSPATLLPTLYTDAAVTDAATAEGEEDCEDDSSPAVMASLGTELVLRARKGGKLDADLGNPATA